MKKLKIILLIILMLIPSIFNFYPDKVGAKTIAELREELRKIEEKEEQNNSNIAKTEAEIEAAKNQVSANYAQIDQINKDIIAADEEIKNLEEEIKKKDETTKKLMLSLQTTNGNSFYIEYLFGADSITDFIYRYSITEQITTYNEKLVVEMNKMIDETKEKKIYLKNKQEELNKKQQELATQITELTNSNVKLYELGTSIEDEIKNAKQVIQMYVNAGCGEYEDIKVCANKLLPSDTKFWRPFDSGYVTSEYGYRNAIYVGNKLISSAGIHEGMDFSNGLGKNNPIYSVANGKVAAIWYDIWGGNQITIHHNINGKTYSSSYAHMSKITVNKGDIVTKDTIIGYMGATGSATGYHLHLAISTGLRFTEYSGYSAYVARTVNPRNLINFPSGYRSWSDRIHYYN